MSEAPQPARLHRRLALALGALGGALLVAALWGFVGIVLSARAPGATAGGAATIEQRCSRGVPADLAQACIEEDRQRTAVTAGRLGLAGALGGVLLILAIRVGRSAGRGAKNHRSSG